MMYEQLANVLGTADEPHEEARAALEALREPTSEVLAAGIRAEQWRAAIDAMLANADAIDAKHAEEAAGLRRSMWPDMLRELEALGCRLWHPTDDSDAWRIEGPGVNIDLNLATGEIDDEGLYYVDDPFAQLVKHVGKRLEARRLRDATEARKEQLRRDHTWSNKLKGWVPKSGQGPIIRGGGAAG
jgi:hypothetical protein